MRSPSLMPVLFAPIALVAGCAGTPERPDFDSAVSGDRVNAIVSTPDVPAVQVQLVEQLDAADDLVRMLAILRLEAETGERLDYAFDANLTARDAAIERWVALEEASP